MRTHLNPITLLSIISVFVSGTLGLCPGAPLSNYKAGTASCSFPSWTMACYKQQQYFPSSDPTKYFQCTSVAVLERSCAPGTCFQPSVGRCTFASSWFNECWGKGPTTLCFLMRFNTHLIISFF